MRSLTKLQKITLALTFVYAAYVRFQDLGYSEFQGDEILTLDFTRNHFQGGFLRYLLTRNKGPLQYIVNALNYSIFGNFNEARIRLPYAIAGTLFVVAVFYLTREIAGSNWAGIAASTLAAINGLFIAFSRIAQYQAFVQLLLTVTILVLVKTASARTDLARGHSDANSEMLAGALFGLATLFHYDALTFLAFACFYFGKRLLNTLTGLRHSGSVPVPAKEVPKQIWDDFRKRVKEAFAFFALFLVVTGSFYVPFFLQPSAEGTSNYLQRRVLGGGFMPRTLYTKILMKFYMPKELLFALVILSCVALWFVLKIKACQPKERPVLSERTGLSDLTHRLVSTACYLLPAALIFTFWFSTQWIKPRGSTLLFYLLALATAGLLFFTKEINLILSSLYAWFLASSCFYLFFNKTPRTHVYIIFIPMFILSGYTLSRIWESRLLARVNPTIKKAAQALLVGLGGYVFILTLAYNYKTFVEKTPEYLWGSKKVFGREMIHIEKNLHGKVQGIFGFPQQRGWKKINQLFEKGCLVGTYSTNEKDRIPEFYLGRKPVQGSSDNIILVESPVSWNYQDLDKTPKSYVLLKVSSIGGHPVTAIYGKEELYPNGKILCE